jgi:hypothetical protein
MSNQIKFEALKKDLVRGFCSKFSRNFSTMHNPFIVFAVLDWIQSIKNGSKISLIKYFRKMEDECVSVIESSDIRSIPQLIEIIPDSFPVWMKSGNYFCDLSDNGWIIYRI